MYLFTLLTVGKLRQTFWRDAQSEYLKRLKTYARCSVREVGETRFRDSTDRQRVIQEEGRALISKIPSQGSVCALSPEGTSMTSERFADFIERTGDSGNPITFVIGGPLGLSDEITSKADMILSLSALTFTHELARIVLLEQLYRAMAILHGKKYHY